jgi:hypothetical protein
MIMLAHCGHNPWGERLAREQFYEILECEQAADSLHLELRE